MKILCLAVFCLSFSSLFAAKAPSKTSEAAFEKYLSRAAFEIDKRVAEGFKKNKIKVPAVVNDATFLRRTYLNTVGRIPTLEEVVSFIEIEDDNKRSLMIKYLLNSSGYDSHTINWFNDLFRIQDYNNGGKVSPLYPYVFYIRQAVEGNKPWDQLTSELLSAEGWIWHNGAAGYYAADKGMLHDNLAISMRVFLGTRMECAQCHDNPEFLDDDWERKEFFELAAFVEGQKDINPKIRSLYTSFDRREQWTPIGRLSHNVYWQLGYTGLTGGGVGRISLPSDYQYRDGDPGEILGAKTPFEPKQRISVKSRKANGRQKLAEWVTSTENKRFAQTMANRLWKRVIGVGLYEPVDSFVNANETSNPLLTKYLSQLFVDLNYDIKAFQHVLLMTRVYQFDSNPKQLAKGENCFFNGRQLSRLSSEQIWDSLLALKVGDLKKLPVRKYTEGVTVMGQEKTRTTMRQLASDLEAIDSVEGIRNYLEKLLAKSEGVASGEGSARMRAPAYMLVPDVSWRGLQGFVRASEYRNPAPLTHFLRQFGQSQRLLVEGNTLESNISQALTILNGHIQSNIVSDSNASIYTMLENFSAPEDKVRALFLSILTRQPTHDELKLMMDEVREFGGDKAYSNIIAALLYTSEFLFLK